MFAWANAHLEEGGAGLAMGRDEDAPDAGGVEELRRQVEALWLENAVMGETIRVLKADDPRLDPSMLTNWSRTRIIDAIRGEFGLARALQATGLKRGTYYYERGVIAAGDKYAVLRARVASGLVREGRARAEIPLPAPDSAPRRDGPARRLGKVVCRIMREEGLRAVYLKRPKRRSSYAGEIGEVPAHLAERDFHAGIPNLLYVEPADGTIPARA